MVKEVLQVDGPSDHLKFRGRGGGVLPVQRNLGSRIRSTQI